MRRTAMHWERNVNPPPGKRKFKFPTLERRFDRRRDQERGDFDQIRDSDSRLFSNCARTLPRSFQTPNPLLGTYSDEPVEKFGQTEQLPLNDQQPSEGVVLHLELRSSRALEAQELQATHKMNSDELR